MFFEHIVWNANNFDIDILKIICVVKSLSSYQESTSWSLFIFYVNTWQKRVKKSYDSFICENHRKINKIMHCVEKVSASFEDMAIFHVNLEIDR